MTENNNNVPNESIEENTFGEEEQIAKNNNTNESIEENTFGEEEQEGNPMTEKALRAIIKKHNLYSTPGLNDVLYLHYKGFTTIAHLEPYVNLKALWLNNNAISQIEGLTTLKSLKCLYLGNNLIDEISGLESLQQLDTLSLSHNYISKITGLSFCPNLKTLELDHNKLRNPDDLAGVLEAPHLQVLNITDNNIFDERFVEILSGLKELRVLRANGNPVCREMKNYRRRIILMFPELTYLDDSPINEEDRRLAKAWQEGGKEAEAAERAKIKEEKDKEHARHMKEFRQMQRKAILDAGLSLDDHPDLKSDDDEVNVKKEEIEPSKENNEDDIFFITEGADKDLIPEKVEQENTENNEQNTPKENDPNEELD